MIDVILGQFIETQSYESKFFENDIKREFTGQQQN